MALARQGGALSLAALLERWRQTSLRGSHLRGAAGRWRAVASIHVQLTPQKAFRSTTGKITRSVTIGLTGAAIARQVDQAISYFRAALDRNKEVSDRPFQDPGCRSPVFWVVFDGSQATFVARQ